MRKRSAIVISGVMALSLLAGVVGANRATIASMQPQVVVRHAATQSAPVPQQPDPAERE